MLERDLAYVKPCGGAVPPVAFKEFDLPQSLISRKVHKALVHSPSGRQAAIDVLGTQGHSDENYIAMCCREDLDRYLRQRAVERGAELIEGELRELNVEPGGVTVQYRERASNQMRCV